MKLQHGNTLTLACHSRIYLGVSMPAIGKVMPQEQNQPLDISVPPALSLND